MRVPYQYTRAAVLRAHPDAWLHPDGLGFVVRDSAGRPLGRKAYSAFKAWREALDIIQANASPPPAEAMAEPPLSAPDAGAGDETTEGGGA